MYDHLIGFQNDTEKIPNLSAITACTYLHKINSFYVTIGQLIYGYIFTGSITQTKMHKIIADNQDFFEKNFGKRIADKFKNLSTVNRAHNSDELILKAGFVKFFQIGTTLTRIWSQYPNHSARTCTNTLLK